MSHRLLNIHTHRASLRKVAHLLITEITTIRSENQAHYKPAQVAFQKLLNKLKQQLNKYITPEHLTIMLTQHIIMFPVFEILSDNTMSANPVAHMMIDCITAFKESGLPPYNSSLPPFWDDVKRSSMNMTIEEKQATIGEIYEAVIKDFVSINVKQYATIYTPIEITDFILHSIEDVMIAHFGYGMGQDGVHLLDPFAGTGRFITQLFKSGIFNHEEIKQKYLNQIWSHDISLLAYYFACFNIEAEYSQIIGEKKAFEGALFVDSFNLNKHPQIDHQDANAERIIKESQDDKIHIIFSHLPYPTGVLNINDGTTYFHVDERIKQTYMQQSATSSFYDQYTQARALRWATDRIGDKGVIGFISNTNFLENTSTSGMRRCLSEEFNDLYIFHLRGNRRLIGTDSEKEGGNIFDSMSGAVISIFVKNPDAAYKGHIHFYDIGDYLSRDEKLKNIAYFKSINGITKEKGWHSITSDHYGDWLNQRHVDFEKFIKMGSLHKDDKEKIFNIYSLGVSTARDGWVWNFSKEKLDHSVTKQIKRYEQIRHHLNEALPHGTKIQREDMLKRFITYQDDLSLTRLIRNDLLADKALSEKDGDIRIGMYRPFCKEFLFFSRRLNERIFHMEQLFPFNGSINKVICLSGAGRSFSCFMTDVIVDLNMIMNGQCFPLYMYENGAQKTAITEEALNLFRQRYPDASQKINAEDIFYYIYGLLHAPSYRQQFAHNLSKDLPRIPTPKEEADFWQFSEIGRQLADLHCHYEQAPMLYELDDQHHVHMMPPSSTIDEGAFYHVNKMIFGHKKEQEKLILDKTTLIYNDYITISHIDTHIYDYIINAKSAIEWVIDCYDNVTNENSSIENNPNDWAVQKEHDPAYTLKLLLRIMYVSKKSLALIEQLPLLNYSS